MKLLALLVIAGVALSACEPYHKPNPAYPYGGSYHCPPGQAKKGRC